MTNNIVILFIVGVIVQPVLGLSARSCCADDGHAAERVVQPHDACCGCDYTQQDDDDPTDPSDEPCRGCDCPAPCCSDVKVPATTGANGPTIGSTADTPLRRLVSDERQEPAHLRELTRPPRPSISV